MRTYFQKILKECSNRELLDKLQCNVIVQAIEYKHNSKFNKDVLKEFTDIQTELLKRMEA